MITAIGICLLIWAIIPLPSGGYRFSDLLAAAGGMALLMVALLMGPR
jgi:hypothetical protein